MLYKEDQVITQLISIGDFIRWGASLFNQNNLYFGHGTSNAMEEAAYLVYFSLKLPNNLHQDYFNCKLLDSEKEAIIKLFQQRVSKRVPASYITQEATFCNLSFYVDERVLVPRSPIAELIQNRFQPWIEEDRVHNILDLCTGSGCIAIACAYAFAGASIDAIELSEDALEVAKINVDKHELGELISLIKSDLFKTLEQDKNKAHDQKYDIIVSNPPYVDTEDMQSLPDEYLAEPELGLAAKDDGLGLAIPMLQQASRYLSDQGILVVEVGNSNMALQETFPDIPFEWIEFENGGHGVFVISKETLDDYF